MYCCLEVAPLKARPSNKCLTRWGQSRCRSVVSRCAVCITCFFSLKHFGHLFHGCIKARRIKVFLSMYFQTFWPEWLNFFRSFRKRFGPWPKNSVELDERSLVSVLVKNVSNVLRTHIPGQRLAAVQVSLISFCLNKKENLQLFCVWPVFYCVIKAV